MPNKISYLSIDPGEKNGCCGYDSNFSLVWMITIPEAEIVDFLAKDTLKTVTVCILEDYKVYPQKARQHIYSSLPTVRVIGRVESWAALGKIQLVKQMANKKATGYRYMGQRPLPKSNPLNHAMDAHAHAVFWGVTNGKIKPESLLEKGYFSVNIEGKYR